MVCVIGMGGGDGDCDGGGGVCGSVILQLFLPNCRTSQTKIRCDIFIESSHTF